MAWFTAKVNVRCNGTRYLKGSVFELDAATAKLSDQFSPCDAPAGTVAKEAPKPAKKAPEQPKPTFTAVVKPSVSAPEADSPKKE